MADAPNSIAENAEPYSVLRLHCPDCGGGGMVRWDRLDKLLYCKGCGSWSRIDTAGTLTVTDPPPFGPTPVRVSVRSGGGTWTDHALPITTTTSSTPWTTPGRGGRTGSGWLRWVLAAVLVFAFGGVSLGLAGWRGRTQTPSALPTELEPRVKLFAEGWLRADVARLLKLTDITEDRVLRRWLVENPLPETAAGIDLKAPAIEVTGTDVPSDSRELQVYVGSTSTGHFQARVTLRQVWRLRDGNWYFSPVASKPVPPPLKLKKGTPPPIGGGSRRKKPS